MTTTEIRAHFTTSEVRPVTDNQWGGIDIYERPSDKTLRLVPTDGDWNNGASVYVLNRSGVLLGQMQTSPVRASLLGDIATLFASGYGMFNA